MNTVKRCRIFSMLTLYRDTRATLLLVNFFKSMRLFRCLFLTSDTPCSMVFIVDFEQENTHWVYSDFSICVHISCHRQILNVVGFLDPHLYCTELLQKQLADSNFGCLCIPAYLRGKYLNKLEKYILSG